MKIKTIVYLIIFFPILGCSVGPDFIPPEQTLPTNWQEASKDTSENHISPENNNQLEKCWSDFNDPLLLSLINRALDSNLDLQQAKSRVLQARASRSISLAGFLPSIDASTSYKRSHSDNSQSSTNNSRVDSSNNKDSFQAGFDASWELDLFGGNRREYEAANAELIVVQENENDVYITLIAEVANHYITLRGLQNKLNIAEKNLEIQNSNANITNKRYQAGFANILDVKNAEAEAASTTARIPDLKSQIKQEMYALSTLLGKDPQALVTELESPFAIPPLPVGINLGIPLDLLRRRPDIRSAEAAAHAATAKVGVAIADLFPKISLSAFIGVQGNRFSSLGNLQNNFWNFGPSAIIPFLDSGRIRANIKVQEALQDQAILEYRKTVLTALNEVESSIVAYKAEQEKQTSLIIAVLANQKALEIANKLYVEGLTDFLNVLNAQRSLYSSEDALSQSEQTAALNLVALYKRLGGTW